MVQNVSKKDVFICRRVPYSLEHLLPADVVKSVMQVPDAASNILQLVLVVALDLASLTNDQVELELDATVGVGSREPVGAAGA